MVASRAMPPIELHGQMIHYEDSGGSGPPVVLAHGFLMDSRMFDLQVAALAPEFRVIRWDSRAFGRSRWDGTPFSLWDLADDCIALLDHLGIRQAVVGGVDLGGHCALRAALRFPERIKGLVLVGPGPPRSSISSATSTRTSRRSGPPRAPSSPSSASSPARCSEMPSASSSGSTGGSCSPAPRSSPPPAV
jgi:pimeloyl-ACP methyl ester carboxylesterase